METRVDSIDAKATDVESDMQGAKLNINDLEAIQTEVTPKIDQAITHPALPDTSLDARNYFPRFSGYMGTRTLPYRSRFHLKNTTSLFFLHVHRLLVPT
eukprot:scaffold114436_cov52-Attheya_sp.AAC.2